MRAPGSHGEDAVTQRFADGLPMLLDGLAHWVDDQRELAEPLLLAAADAHALDRHHAGSELAVLLHEYATLRRTIVEVAIESEDRDEMLHRVVALEAGIDRVTGLAVQRFEREHDHVRERFIGMFVHDLRDPLTAVLMSSSLLADMTLGERQAQLVGRITRGARRIERMIDELVDYARAELGEPLVLARTEFDLTEVCHEAIGEHRAQPAPREIVFEPSGNLAGSWDRERARQAISQLINNASHGSQGAISIRAVEHTDRSGVMIAVSARGPTLSPDMLARLFDPFARAQLDQTGGIRVRGLGLGLYLVERIATAHGGTVRATSSSDAGTTISIDWPRIAASAKLAGERGE